MESGSYKGYHWVVWNSQFLSDLIKAFPQITRGKYVVVTSFDSGSLILSEEEIAQGWHIDSGLAYSPIVTERIELPAGEYDEWYVFSLQANIQELEVFINYSLFNFSNNKPDAETRQMKERFWAQMERLAPESYLADGASLIFITRDSELFKNILRWEYPREET